MRATLERGFLVLRFLSLALLCATLLLPRAAVAAMEITPMAGYRFGGGFETEDGDSLDLGEGGSGALAIDFDYQHNSQIELFWSHQENSLTNPQGGQRFGLGIDYLHIGGTAVFPQGEIPVIPYIAGGLGVTRFDPDRSGTDSETRFSLSLGGGVRYFPFEHVGLRAEVRGCLTLLPDNGAMFCSNGACQVYLAGDALFQFEGLAGIIVRF